MGRYTFFSAGHKTFKVQEISDTWFEFAERRRNYVSRIAVDKLNLLGICKCMELASEGQGRICRNWMSQSQLCSYHIFQNFYTMGRFVKIVKGVVR